MELKEADFKYIENFLNETESLELFRYLIENTNWQEKEIIVFGKKYLQPRLIQWYGDKDYTYSNNHFLKNKMPFILLNLKEKIEKISKKNYNSVLLNYYRDGNDSMGKHSDDEKELGFSPTIASISLGVERDMIIRSKFDKSKQFFKLKNGSLLIMGGNSQKYYTHEIPKRKKIELPRINLTFRYIY
jgi:alkylated DNA repair dioxygenase AlkB